MEEFWIQWKNKKGLLAENICCGGVQGFLDEITQQNRRHRDQKDVAVVFRDNLEVIQMELLSGDADV